MKRVNVLAALALLTASPVLAAGPVTDVVVTSSNTADNQLLVYDTAGTLLQSVPTLGQGGVGGNAGGVATANGTVAVVNFGSQTVSIFVRAGGAFDLQQRFAAASSPVSVAFGKDHLYVLGTTTVESHRLDGDGVDPAADGIVSLLAADGSAAHVGVVGDQLIVTEKSGTIELVPLRAGAASGVATPVALPAAASDTPFGLVTRGSSAYVTIAHSDVVGLVKNGQLIAFAATGDPAGPGQHSPCWIALSGPYLYSTNSPSHSISRLVAGGQSVVLDLPVAAHTVGAPIDIAAEGALLAVVESNGGDASHLTLYQIDQDGDLSLTVSTAIAGPANGVVIVRGR